MSTREGIEAWARRVDAKAPALLCILRNTRVVLLEQAWPAGDASGIADIVFECAELQGRTVTLTIEAQGLDGKAIASTECKLDSNALALARPREGSQDAQRVEAQAAAIAATDHKALSQALVSLERHASRSNDTLLGMVSAFGEAGAAMLAAQGQTVAAMSASIAALQTELEKLRAENRELRDQRDDAIAALKETIALTEKLEKDKSDVGSVARAAFGPTVERMAKDLAKGFNGSEVPLPLPTQDETKG